MVVFGEFGQVQLALALGNEQRLAEEGWRQLLLLALVE